MTKLRAWSVAMVVLALGACGGESDSEGSDDGDGDFSSGVPGSTRLNDLSDSELDRVCRALEEFIESPSVAGLTEEYSCRLGGMLAAAFGGPTTDAEARALCAATYDECRAEAGTSTTTCSRPPATCVATVAEFEACMRDTPAYIEAVLDALPTCDTLTLADLTSEDTPAPVTPASCETYLAKCPNETE